MDWENHLEKKSDPKNRKKTVKVKMKLPQVIKATSDKAKFCSKTVSHSTLTLERKNFMPQNHSLVRSTSCFGVTKITTPI